MTSLLASARRNRSATRQNDDATRPESSRSSAGILVLRLFAGVALAVHGFQKFGDVSGHIESTERFGVPLAPLTGWLSMLGEAGLGLLLMVGLATRISGAAAGVLMATTWLVAHLSDGIVTSEPGLNGENALLLMASGVALALIGAGRYSLDGLMRARAKKEPAIQL